MIKHKTYFIKTFGCQLNFADSERVAAALEKQGYQPSESIEKANLVVINSCIVRESAENRVYGLLNKLKVKNAKCKVILTGCLACSYCIVPYARGREVYRSAEEIIKDMHCAVKQGYSKIMLLGQNVNTWVNADLRGEEHTRINADSFADLLNIVANINGVEEVTFMSANPRDFSDKLIKVIAENKTISREIHLPVQSGDNDILKAMNRGYTREDYLNLIDRIKRKIPKAEITTDLLVGFPGETNQAFKNTVNLCRQVNFKRAFINKYSPRPGTAAAKKYEDSVPHPTKKKRWQALEDLING